MIDDSGIDLEAIGRAQEWIIKQRPLAEGTLVLLRAQ